MKLIVKTLFLLCISFASFGQMNEYNYKIELKGISEPWHKIILPEDIFGKVSKDLSDIRLYGITASNDTIEAPYILNITKEKIQQREITFRQLNTSFNDKGYYFTFEVQENVSINQMIAEFEKQNFDWRVNLEGSQNQNDWYTIVQDYRIVSIKNELTDFQHTKLQFPASKYRYFRLHINSNAPPELIKVHVLKHEQTDGSYSTYPVKKLKIIENKKEKQTEIEVKLSFPGRLSHIQIKVLDTVDYYRPVSIKYLNDSFKTEKGWRYNYATLVRGTLNSIEKSEFSFNSTTTQKLKILIRNHDNQPLNIESIEPKGYTHGLFARFTEKATYFLTYGNQLASKPNYDLIQFADKIPDTLKPLKLGKELEIEKNNKSKTNSLIKNKIWLWAIITVIILILAWFSLKMMKSD